MKRSIALVLGLGLLIGADASTEDLAKKDMKALQGTWVVVEAQREGQPLDRIKGNTLVISDHLFTIKTKTVELKGTFTLDPGKKPKAMDFNHEVGFLRDKTWKAIYSLDGDDLKICYVEADSGKHRPTNFTTAEGSGLLMTILKRERP